MAQQPSWFRESKKGGVCCGLSSAYCTCLICCCPPCAAVPPSSLLLPAADRRVWAAVDVWRWALLAWWHWWLVYCTSGGAIGVLRDAAAGAGRLVFQEPTAAVRACCLGAAGPCTQLFCATDQEGLVFMANAL